MGIIRHEGQDSSSFDSGSHESQTESEHTNDTTGLVPTADNFDSKVEVVEGYDFDLGTSQPEDTPDILDVTSEEHSTSPRTNILSRKPVNPDVSADTSARSGFVERARKLGSSLTILRSDASSEDLDYEQQEEFDLPDDSMMSFDSQGIALDDEAGFTYSESDEYYPFNPPVYYPETSQGHEGHQVEQRAPLITGILDNIALKKQARHDARIAKEEFIATVKQNDAQAILASQEAAAIAERQSLELRQQEMEKFHKTTVDLMASKFNGTNPIESLDHLRLPNPAAINRYLWGDVGLQLVAMTGEYDLKSQLKRLTKILSHDEVQESDIGVVAHELEVVNGIPKQQTPPIMLETAIADRDEFNVRVRTRMAQKLEEMVHAATDKVYVNPTPEDGRTHREYAFELAAEVAGVSTAERDQLVNSRETVVYSRVVLGDDNRYAFDPNFDGASKLIDSCTTSLENVDPEGRDGRASGLIVKLPHHSYDGGIALEIRYDGMKPETGNDIDRPSYIATFAVEARHVKPDVFSALEQTKLDRFSEHGRQDPIDPRFIPVFEAHAIRDVAQPRFSEYAGVVMKSIENARHAKRATFEGQDYSGRWGTKAISSQSQSMGHFPNPTGQPAQIDSPKELR